jgi:hypothetical protein
MPEVNRALNETNPYRKESFMDCNTNIAETREQNNAIPGLLTTVSKHLHKFHDEEFNPADDEELMAIVGDSSFNVGIYFPEKVRVYQFKNGKVTINDYRKRTHSASKKLVG